MMPFAFLIFVALFVGYANGANDNFKGVATLYGANVASYKKAIIIATVPGSRDVSHLSSWRKAS